MARLARRIGAIIGVAAIEVRQENQRTMAVTCAAAAM
jgi:hypothetical protein